MKLNAKYSNNQETKSDKIQESGKVKVNWNGNWKSGQIQLNKNIQKY